MQGIYYGINRIKTKKLLKSLVITELNMLALEATSLFGNEYGGPLELAPDGTYTIVGPDPYKSRKWYANIKKTGSSIKVS